MTEQETISTQTQRAESELSRNSADSNTEIAGALGDVWLTLLRLGRLEIQGSIKAVPGFVQLGLMRVPAFLLLWCSFCALVSWWVYELAGQALAGFATLFLLQGALVTGIHLKSARSMRLMSLPNTREYASRLLDILDKDGRRGRNGEDTADAMGERRE